MVHKIYIQVNTDITASEQVLLWFEQLNQPHLPDVKIWWQCQTLLYEGFTNTVEHAHKNLPFETPINIEGVRSKNYIEIRIWCYGSTFNLKQKLLETPQLEDNNDERGRGLKVMSLIADELSYTPTTDNRQCLWIIKYY